MATKKSKVSVHEPNAAQLREGNKLAFARLLGAWNGIGWNWTWDSAQSPILELLAVLGFNFTPARQQQIKHAARATLLRVLPNKSPNWKANNWTADDAVKVVKVVLLAVRETLELEPQEPATLPGKQKAGQAMTAAQLAEIERQVAQAAFDDDDADGEPTDEELAELES